MRLSLIILLSYGTLLLAGCATVKPVDIESMPMPETIFAEKSPGSLWPGENGRNRLFTDFRARDIGDIITVTIKEKTAAKREALTKTSRASDTDAAITNMFGLPLNMGMRDFLNQGNAFSPTIKGSNESSFDGSGTTERSGEITATITTAVKKVLPNGLLYIEGRKETKVNKEKQYILLSGLIRPVDISSVNTVSSDAIADLRVELSGYGVINDKQTPGWMTRAVDTLWPF